MATLLEDIKTQAAWIVQAFHADGLKLDYSLESFKEIDRFFDLHVSGGVAKPKGRLAQNMGPILFSIGSYIGETFVRNIPGAIWVTDDQDPQGEINVEVRLPDGTVVWPTQRAIKRFKDESDGIYAYGYLIMTKMATGNYWDDAKAGKLKSDGIGRSPWWKRLFK